MKRLQLTDEEVRLIESRRKDEARFNAGINQGIEIALSYMTDNDLTNNERVVLMNKAKRAVKV